MPDTATIESDHQMEVSNLPELDATENDSLQQEGGPPLMPVEALRDEQTQLEAWVHQSFSALERLHSELDEWQRELTEQQVDLDANLADKFDSSEQLRQLKQDQEQLEHDRDQALQKVCQLETALEQCQASLAALESNQSNTNEQQEKLSQQYDHATQELSQAYKEVQQLEEENAEQAQELEELDRVVSSVQAELKAIREHSEQQAQSLESEQLRSAEQQRHWSNELKEMRLLLGRQCDLMVHGSTDAQAHAPSEPERKSDLEQITDSPVQGVEKDIPSSSSLNLKDKRSDEIRRRAKSRRASKRRNRKQSE